MFSKDPRPSMGAHRVRTWRVHFALWAFGLLLFGFGSGCSLIGEPKDKNPAPIETSGPQCISTFGQSAQDYFGGRSSSDAEAQKLTGCATGSLKYFMQFTKGADEASYTREELRKFINSYLGADKEISPELMFEAMKLKSSLFGGSPERATRVELGRIVDFLTMLTPHLVVLRHYMPFALKQPIRLSDAEVDDFAKKTQAAGQDIGTFFETSGSDYAVVDLTAFLSELDAFLGPSPKGSILQFIREQISVLQAFKGLLFGSTETAILKNEWSSIFERGARLYGLFLLVSKQGEQLTSWDKPENFDAIEKIADTAIGLLTDVVASHPRQKIEAQEFEHLVAVLEEQVTTPNLQSSDFMQTLTTQVARFVLIKEFLLGNGGRLDQTALIALPDFIHKLKDPLRRISPYLKDLSLKSLSPPELEKAFALFETAAAAAGSALRDYESRARVSPGSAYTFTNFSSVYQRIEHFLSEKDPLRVVAEYWQTIGRTLKAVVIGQPYTQISPQNWADLFSHAATFHRIYVLYGLFSDYNARPSNREAVDTVFRIATEGLQILSKIGISRPILTTEIASLVDALPIGQDTRTLLQNVLPDILELKAAILGGSSSELTGAEGAALLAWSRDLHDAASELIAFWPFSFNDLRTWPVEKVEALSQALIFAGRRIDGGLNHSQASTYSFASFDKLLTRLQRLSSKKTADDIQNIRDAIPMATVVKPLVIGPMGPTGPSGRATSDDRHGTIEPSDWSHLFGDLGNWAAIGVQAYYFAKSPTPITRGPGLARLTAFANLVENSLMRSIRNYRTSEREGLPYREFEHLLDDMLPRIQNHGVLTTLKIESAKALLRPLFSRILGGMRASERGPAVGGLTPIAVTRTKAEIDRWLQNQNVLDRIFRLLDPSGRAFSSDGFTRGDLLQAINRLSVASDLNAQALSRVRRIIETTIPYFLGQDQIFSFLYDSKRENLYSFNDLTIKNSLGAGARLIVLAYAADPQRAANILGINRDELEAILKDLNDPALDLKIISRQKTPAELATRRFREAEIFMPHAQGAALLDIPVLTDFLALLWSSFPVSSDTHDKLAALCAHAGLDDRDSPLLDTACYRRTIWSPDWFEMQFGGHFPRLAEYLRALTETDREQLIHNMEVAARNHGFSPLPHDSVDTDGYVSLFVYIEFWFKRFDIDRSGRLEFHEALQGFSVVCRELQALSGFSGRCPDDAPKLETLYGYILTNGAPPKPGKGAWGVLTAATDWAAWYTKWWWIRKFDCESCFKPTDRGRIADILSALSE